jgi:hypothetical protein
MPNSKSGDKSGTPMPSVAEMRESQRQGSIGQGTQSESYAGMEASFNEGTGEASDEKPTITNKAGLLSDPQGFDPWSGK